LGLGFFHTHTDSRIADSLHEPLARAMRENVVLLDNDTGVVPPDCMDPLAVLTTLWLAGGMVAQHPTALRRRSWTRRVPYGIGPRRYSRPS
jgi:hypothetical protein